jgi:hypothetical protein
MNFFEEAALRLKQQLRVTEDKQAAELLGMTGNAWVLRKRRQAFPVQEIHELAAKRPDLGLDVTYVLTGKTQRETLAERAAAVTVEAALAHDLSKKSPAFQHKGSRAGDREGALVEAWRACSQEDRALIEQLAERLANKTRAGEG